MQLALRMPLLYTFTRFYYNVKSKSVRMKGSLILLATLMGKKDLNILLADDDEEDREIFTEAIGEIAPHVKVSACTNGHDLMSHLKSTTELPDIIFLDLNMPLKNGQECLAEIKADKDLKDIPVVIYSTSSSREHIDETYKRGANFYIPKPDSFADLKLIAKRILLSDLDVEARPLREKFVLSAAHLK